jgi:hypothetical protein
VEIEEGWAGQCKEEHGLTAKSIELGTGPWQQRRGALAS